MEQRPKLGGMFREVMAKNAPELFAKVDKELKEEYERKHRKTKWELLISGEDSSPSSSSDPVATSNSSASTFGFGFNFD
ncbi:hypothetical protein ON010_g1412 [Phytophthora cinnamomi]|nr:hypothetical protein ON010_g1412 [Phytophthora cinnamomi]